jgi:undecaprenyl phosphate N,N'-diacetylbacillosamine 1-phosphate transferase
VHTLRSIIKRAMDLAISLFCAPFALLAVAAAALAIRLESPGGAFFLQERIGRGGRPFSMVKLRTMVQGAATMGAGLYFEKNDPRFTKVGLFLRRLSLDELPQLWNILKGDMSVVGPRPTLRFICDRYPDEYARILRVKPGMTGLAQVSGRNEVTRTARLKIDAYYAEEWSIGMDVKILFRTFGVVLGGGGQRTDMSENDLEQ